MRVACLILTGILALPAFADESVADLIRALGDDAPAVRDRAQAELEKRGAPVVDELESAIGAPEFRDAEIQARLREVVAKARQSEAWEKDSTPLAAEAVKAEVCPICKQPNYEIAEAVTQEDFRDLFEDVKLFRALCRQCKAAHKGPATAAILLLKKSGGHKLLRGGHVSHIAEIKTLLRPVTSADSARETAAALVALYRHAEPVRALEVARKSASAAARPAGGFRVTLKDLGDEVIFEFDADGRLLFASRADG
ncbi:MAG: hypothetical protein FD180_3333 [Planctomycetota bacterium]|nr:MAG: hypothetical protein FD180_3333 [Planctomycetota bacterium]